MKVLVSTGVFIGRPNGRNHRLLETVVDQVEADGFELMIYDDWYPNLESVASDIAALGCHIPVLHVEKSIGHLIGLGTAESRRKAFDYFAQNLQAAGKVGADKLVLHLWNGPSLDSCIERNLDAYFQLKTMAEEAGMLLTVENVVSYGETADHPLDYFERLRAMDPDVKFTYDLKMAAFHRQNRDIFQPRWQFLWRDGFCAHLHLSDYAGGYMDWEHLRTRHLGEGHIDFSSFFSEYRKYPSCDTLTLECLSFRADGSLDVDGINRDIRLTRELIK